MPVLRFFEVGLHPTRLEKQPKHDRLAICNAEEFDEAEKVLVKCIKCRIFIIGKDSDAPNQKRDDANCERNHGYFGARTQTLVRMKQANSVKKQQGSGKQLPRQPQIHKKLARRNHSRILEKILQVVKRKHDDERHKGDRGGASAFFGRQHDKTEHQTLDDAGEDKAVENIEIQDQVA